MKIWVGFLRCHPLTLRPYAVASHVELRHFFFFSEKREMGGDISHHRQPTSFATLNLPSNSLTPREKEIGRDPALHPAGLEAFEGFSGETESLPSGNDVCENIPSGDRLEPPQYRYQGSWIRHMYSKTSSLLQSCIHRALLFSLFFTLFLNRKRYSECGNYI